MSGSVNEWLDAARLSLQLMKEALPLIPKGKNQDALEAEIAKASEALKRSDAALAKELGYRLCRCKFPPEIMLWDKEQDAEVCRNCGTKSSRHPTVNRDGGRLVRSRLPGG